MKALKMPEDLSGPGKLVFAVIRPYKGRGKQKLILHEVTLGPKKSFMYGNGKTYIAGVAELKQVS